MAKLEWWKERIRDIFEYSSFTFFHNLLREDFKQMWMYTWSTSLDLLLNSNFRPANFKFVQNSVAFFPEIVLKCSFAYFTVSFKLFLEFWWKKNGYESPQLTIAPEICFCVVTWLIDLKSNKTSTIIQEFIIYFFGAFYHLARNSQQINVVLTKFGGQFSIRSFI